MSQISDVTAIFVSFSSDLSSAAFPFKMKCNSFLKSMAKKGTWRVKVDVDGEETILNVSSLTYPRVTIQVENVVREPNTVHAFDGQLSEQEGVDAYLDALMSGEWVINSKDDQPIIVFPLRRPFISSIDFTEDYTFWCRLHGASRSNTFTWELAKRFPGAKSCQRANGKSRVGFFLDTIVDGY